VKFEDLVQLYDVGDEDARLVAGRNRVEWVRTVELLTRWLPPAPARVLDVGGASGRYAAWLLERGYQVQVVDLVPKHVRQARDRGLAAVQGDARALPCPEASADAVLLMGPLYHLPDGPDRATALAEAARCTVPGGVLVVAAMSRWAKAAVRTVQDQLGDVAVQAHLLRVMEHGHDSHGDAFEQVSYNHDPAALCAELVSAGLRDVTVVGVEGPLGAQARRDTRLEETAVAAARLAETAAPHLSIHLLARGLTTSVSS
jgi:ubiquinone/menaquinone biosynthesis C-methylase UbiE